jgi:plasmid stabilization system protein ParE
LKVRFLRAAQNDLREAVRYYNAQRRGLGDDFREEVREVIERIKALPDAWHPIEAEARRCRTQRFPYGVIYLVEGSEIVVVAVANLHRDPDHWKDRL